MRSRSDTRSKALRAATQAAHERLDGRIMAADPFGSRAQYGRFLRVQHAFHRDIDALYGQPDLVRLLPDLAGRRRSPLVEQDLADLELAAVPYAAPPIFGSGEAADLPSALGWLYVAEGSNLGAAFLLKEAVKLGLSDTFGARHLAGAPEGRARHWHGFTAMLDAVSLTAAEEAHAVGAAQTAFARVQDLVETLMPAAAANHRSVIAQDAAL